MSAGPYHDDAFTDAEEKLRFALRAAKAGMWQWTPATDECHWSATLCELYGLATNAQPPGFECWLEGIHPDDRQTVRHTILTAVKNKREFRAQWRQADAPQGSPRWLETQGRPILWPNGELKYYIGMIFDITTCKMTELEQQLWSNAFQQAEIFLAISDVNTGRLVAVNSSYAHRHGYKPEELIGKPVEDFYPPEEHERLKRFFTMLNRKAHGTFQSEHICRDGTHFPVRAEVSLIRSAGRRSDKLVATVHDLTKCQQAEQKLQQARLIFDKATEGIVLTDTEGCIISCNPAFQKLTGSDGIGTDLAGWLIAEAGQTLPPMTAFPHRQNGVWQGQANIRNVSSETTPVMMQSSVVYNNAECRHVRITTLTDISQLKKAEAEIAHNANYDPLTGLPNRRLFLDRLHQELLQARRRHHNSALLFLDLDNFKVINDTFGHAAGDALLIEAAGRISRTVRDYDCVARLGGDEFTIILSDYGIRSVVERVAREIIANLSRPFEMDGSAYFVTASIGISIFPADAHEANGIIKCADQAMYMAKKNGRNQYLFYTRQMQEAASLRARLAQDMRQAILQNQFEVHYQPIISLNGEKSIKAEALLRWKHPEHGYISPAVFIPVAEEHGFIGEISDFVLQETIRHLQQWQNSNCRPLQISLNISPVQLRESRQWLQLAKPLAENGIRPHALIVEITEGMLLDDDRVIRDNLSHLRRAGVKIALDDFGTGYSSLSYLNKFAIDFLKIDKSFVDNLVSSPSDRVLCDAIIAMSHKLGHKVVAEGIETETQRGLLTDLGCDFGQGYLFARALPWQDFLPRAVAGFHTESPPTH